MSIATKRLSNLRRSAYRHAGRAVMCILQRRGFHAVSIPDKGNPRGGLEMTPIQLYHGDRSDPDPWKAEREVIIELAGPIAEKIAAGHHRWRGTGSDLLSTTRAIELASQLNDSHETTRAYLKFLWLQTRDTLLQSAHWAAVQLLAAELIEERHVSARRARRLFREAVEGQR